MRGLLEGKESAFGGRMWLCAEPPVSAGIAFPTERLSSESERSAVCETTLDSACCNIFSAVTEMKMGGESDSRLNLSTGPGSSAWKYLHFPPSPEKKWCTSSPAMKKAVGSVCGLDFTGSVWRWARTWWQQAFNANVHSQTSRYIQYVCCGYTYEFMCIDWSWWIPLKTRKHSSPQNQDLRKTDDLPS